MPKWVPTMPELLREALIVAGGALIAAIVVRSLPPDVRGLFNLTGGNSNG